MRSEQRNDTNQNKSIVTLDLFADDPDPEISLEEFALRTASKIQFSGMRPHPGSIRYDPKNDQITAIVQGQKVAKPLSEFEKPYIAFVARTCA